MPAAFVLVYIDLVVGGTLFAKELLGLLAICAPRGTVDCYFCAGRLLSSKGTENRLHNICA